MADSLDKVIVSRIDSPLFVYVLSDSVIADLAKRCYSVLAGFVPAGVSLRHTTCVLCSRLHWYTFPLPRVPLRGSLFPLVLPRYRLPCRPSDVRLRSVTSCPRPAVALLKERYRVPYRARVFITSRERWERTELPPCLGGKSILPSVDGRSLRHVLVRQISAPAL